MQTLASFQRVVVEAKVVRVDDSMEVTGGKVKQDILIGDELGQEDLLFGKKLGRLSVMTVIDKAE